MNLKRKKFSFITFNFASLSRRAIARRWSQISHCLGSLARINRHNLEKYLSYNHSFHWTLKLLNDSPRISKRHFKSKNSFLEEEIASVPFFSLIPRFSRLPPEEHGTLDAFRAYSHVATITRTIARITGGRLTLWRKLTATGQPDFRQLTVPSWIPSRLCEPPP